MPRMSAEARGASVFMTGGLLAAVPVGLSVEAAKIWQDVVSAKPADWFDAGSLLLLQQLLI